jgi:hypothetical protein
MTGRCKSCGKDEELIEGVCTDCIFKMAEQHSKISKADIERVRREVELETAGLFPPETLRELLEGAIDEISAGAPRDEVLGHLSNEIQRLGGLGVCRELNRFAEGWRTMTSQVSQGLSDTIEAIEEEVKRKIRILSALPRRGSP